MNIILFYPAEVQLPLSRLDPRAHHILNVLRLKTGERVDVGLINGPRGKATLNDIQDEALFMSYEWGDLPSSLVPIRLIVGLPRPQTARDILRESASIGVAAINFVITEKTDRSYIQSSLWCSGEVEKLLITGAAQAFCTRLPEVQYGQSLAEGLQGFAEGGTRIAMDNYESPTLLSHEPLTDPALIILAVGGERGWSAADRAQLRAHDFTFAHLGERVLRTETACITALALLKAKLGLL